MRTDLRGKEGALNRVKCLATAGLPLEPFARAVLDLVLDGTPADMPDGIPLQARGCHPFAGLTIRLFRIIESSRRQLKPCLEGSMKAIYKVTHSDHHRQLHQLLLA
jgi:hypothetical protein